MENGGCERLRMIWDEVSGYYFCEIDGINDKYFKEWICLNKLFYILYVYYSIL